MPRLNKVIVIGRLVKEPELEHIGKSVVSRNSVAINDSYKKGDEWVEKTVFIDIEAWGFLAEKLTQMEKGQEVLVEGKLQQDNWEDKNGNKRSKIYVRVDKIQGIKKTNKTKEKENNEDDYFFEGF